MSHSAAYYRRQADHARSEAERATLGNVRDRALRSFSAFQAIAEQIERVARLRAAREAKIA